MDHEQTASPGAGELHAQVAQPAPHGGSVTDKLLTPDPGVMIWVWVVFFCLLLLLRKYAWNPLLAALRQREKTISDSLARVEEIEKRSESLEADQRKILEEARSEANRILAEQRVYAEKFRENAEREAKVSAESLVRQAKDEIVATSQNAQAQLKRDAAKLSVDIAEKILRKELNDAQGKDYANRVLDEMTGRK